MDRVAANQERSEADRVHYVYLQHARVLSRKGKTVLCEEITDSRITPSPTGSHIDLLKLDGRVLQKHTYVPYTTLPPRQTSTSPPIENQPGSISINIGDDDRELVEDLRASLTRDDSRDGVNPRLFPLTSTRQKDYQFHLVGRDRMNGRDVFHLDFRPRNKSDFGWKGDAYIDTATFQPVVISTAMARKIPFAARTLLGTNVPGLGFTITYAPQPDGVWFPVSFGTEFKLHVLFFFSRQIVIDALNRNFEKTHVTSEMLPVGDPVKPRYW